MKKIWTEYRSGKNGVSVVAWYDKKTCTLRVEVWNRKSVPEITLETRSTREAALRRVMQLADLAFWYAERGTAKETDNAAEQIIAEALEQ